MIAKLVYNGVNAMFDSEFLSQNPDLNPSLKISVNRAFLSSLAKDDVFFVDLVLNSQGTFYIGRNPNKEASDEESLDVTEVLQKPSVASSHFIISDKTWRILLRNYKRKLNTLILGDSGTGKTSLFYQLAKSLNTQISVFDMGAIDDAQSTLIGVHRLDNGSSVFDYSRFVSAIQKPGIVVLDELSRAPLSCLNILFPVLDSRRELFCENSPLRESIKVHEDCWIVSTANVGFSYTGTNQLDLALVSRFFTYTIPPYTRSEVSSLLKLSNLSPTDIQTLAEFYVHMGKQYKDFNISTPVSIRDILGIRDLLLDGFGFAESVDYWFDCRMSIEDRSFVDVFVLSI